MNHDVPGAPLYGVVRPDDRAARSSASPPRTCSPARTAASPASSPSTPRPGRPRRRQGSPQRWPPATRTTTPQQRGGHAHQHAHGPVRPRRPDRGGASPRPRTVRVPRQGRPPARRRGEEKGDLQKEPPGGIATEPDDHGLGRSRGGLSTKLHLATEQGQKPMSIVITAGQRGDCPQFEPVLEKVRVPRIGPGRSRTRPDRVRADKAYASRKNRAYLRRRGIRCTIPDKADHAATARSWALVVAAHRSSTRSTTANATRWSAASIA
ncbi:transposase [Streptomyces pharetrae]|uniref:transposase n=1 Tax=Streptomyces pharetrae TaxID=291370 RepID=UPI00384F7887